MGQLQWDPTDFIECLEVLPTIDDYEVRHRFRVDQGDLVMELSVFQFESFVTVSFFVRGTQEAHLSLSLVVFGPCTFVRERGREYIDLNDARLAASRFWRNEFDEAMLTSVPPLRLRLSRKPLRAQLLPMPC